MKKRVIYILFSIVIAMVLCVGMTACGDSDDAEKAEQEQAITEQEEQEEEEDIEELQKIEAAEEEMIAAEENAEETPVLPTTKYEDFVGTWKTITSNADDSFGGYQITFNKNKTFDAVITGEEETGKCSFENGVVKVQNEVLNDEFWFNEDKILVVRSENEAMAMLKKVK